MTQYAKLDLKQTPPEVIGFFDTVAHDYSSIDFSSSEYVALSDAQWQVSQSQPAGWNWVASDFAARPPPPMPPAVQADVEMASRVALGIAVTGYAGLTATYALDQLTLDQIGSVARDAASGLGFPNNLSTFTYPDQGGSPHAFTEAQVISLYKAMRDLMLNLNTQSQVMRFGGTPIWPSQASIIN